MRKNYPEAYGLCKIRRLARWFAIICLVLLSLSSLLGGVIVPGKVITDFDNEGGIPAIEYILQWDKEEDIGLEAKGYVTLPSHRGEIRNASLKIKCLPDKNNNYLTDPRLDIGLDGDFEWRFSGPGYGKPGYQTKFGTDKDNHLIKTDTQGLEHFDNSSVIYLPKDSDVTSASMKIKGGPGHYREDLVVGITNSGNIYYAKSNNGAFHSYNFFQDLSPSGGYSVYGIGLGDFDNDNDLDLVTGYRMSFWTPINFYLYRNPGLIGANPPWETTPIFLGSLSSTSSRYLRDFAVEDYNNDGFLDFVVSDYYNDFFFFEGNGQLAFNETLITNSYAQSYNYGKDAADFNNDGNMDFVSGSNSQNVYYFEGLGDKTFLTEVGTSAGTWSQYSVIAGDFNEDQNQDIIAKSTSSNFYFIGGKGDGTFFNPSTMSLTPTSYMYGGDNYDYNYDGHQDLVMSCRPSPSSSFYHFYYYTGLGGGSFNPYIDIGNTGSSATMHGVATPPFMPLGRCQNLTMDLGDDNSPEKVFNGHFGSELTVDFTVDLNSMINNPNNGLKVIIDNYGNEMYKIPIRFESDTTGRVFLHSLDIKYNYTAKVELLPPGRYNLTTDLNDLLPIDENVSGLQEVYFGVYSDTPGKVKLSDLHIEFNNAPEFLGISTQILDEDTVTKVLNLTELDNQGQPKYFYDEDDTSLLTYGIESYDDNEHFAISVTDDKWLSVDCTLVPNWHGSTMVKIWCKDTEGIKSFSDEFEVRVQPIDDPPMVKNPVPNLNLREKEVKIPIDLDDPTKEYFFDVDSEVLYYRAVLAYPESHGNLLTVEVLQETNELRVQSIGKFAKNIEVRIYCDDDAELLELSVGELEIVDAYQSILVNVTSSTATFPPQWQDITIEPIPEDKPQIRILNLKNYVIDEDDVVGNLSFSIYSLTESGYIDIVIEDNSDLSIYPRDNFDGTAYMTLAVTDDEYNRDLTVVPIEIIPFNDLPIVAISEPQDGSTVIGIADIIGSAYDPEGELAKVEISIGISGTWTSVNGLGYWTYTLDVAEFPSAQSEILVKVRAEDSSGSQSIIDKISLKLLRQQIDTDGDGVEDIKDQYPNNPTEWKDSDNDGYGDNIDKFPQDDTQWLDTDEDGYGDNLNGNSPDQFPTDPTQWNDTDRDGYGDNPWGNDADYYPHDPDQWERPVVEDAKKEKRTGEVDMYLITFAGLGIAIVITVIIFLNFTFNYIKNQKKLKKIRGKEKRT